MPQQETDNAAQARYWSSQPGRKWIDNEAALDAAMAPALALLIDRAGLRVGEKVLDIGCGTGASCLAAAREVGPAGQVVGVDIAPPLLARAAARVAEARLGNVTLTEADAARERFDAGHFDAAISRFGVMFFADPVAAIANIARATKPGGRIAFVAWAGSARNPWFAIANEAAVRRLGSPPPTDPDAPGPMGFQNLGRVVGLLEQAGLAEVAGEAVPAEMTPVGSPREVARLMTQIGPAVRLIQHFGGSPEDGAAIETAIEAELIRYQTRDGIRVPATLNQFTAIRP